MTNYHKKKKQTLSICQKCIHQISIWSTNDLNDLLKCLIYLSNSLDENLLGLLSCGIWHLKLFSKITKHTHTDAICITANELVRIWGKTVGLPHRKKALVNSWLFVGSPYEGWGLDNFLIYNYYRVCRLTLIGGCCEWQNSFTFFCKLNLASVRITHCWKE